MKPLHLITYKSKSKGDYDRPGMAYIQVKEGIVYVTNSSVALRIPVSEIFGEVVGPDEHFYLSSDEWKSSGMYKATNIAREDDNYFIAFDNKKKQLGRIKLVSEKEFKILGYTYPNVDSVYPDISSMTPIDRIGISPEQIALLAKAMGIPYACLAFSSIDRALLVHHPDTEGVGLIMPMYIAKWPWEKEGKPEETPANEDYSDLL
jgi:hypothetical protein